MFEAVISSRTDVWLDFCPKTSRLMRASLGLAGLVLVLAASLRGAHGAPGSIPAVYALLDRVLPANTSSLFQLQLTADLTVRFLHSATLPCFSQVMNDWLGQPPRAVHPPQACFLLRIVACMYGEVEGKRDPLIGRVSSPRRTFHTGFQKCLFVFARNADLAAHHVPPAPWHCSQPMHMYS